VRYPVAVSKLTMTELKTVPPPPLVIEVVEEILKGNREAERVFYEAFRPHVEKLVRRWNWQRYGEARMGPCTAEDTTQDVLVHLLYGKKSGAQDLANHSPLKKWLDFDGPNKKSLYRYAMGNAHYCLRDLGKAHVLDHQRTVRVDTLPECPHSNGPGKQADFKRCFRECWRRLNPSYREVLDKVCLEGLSQVEVASRLGVGEATISRWLRDAKKVFWKCLGSECPEDLINSVL
jgi:RNA polymerase sigma factor (sigma-70 family)